MLDNIDSSFNVQLNTIENLTQENPDNSKHHLDHLVEAFYTYFDARIKEHTTNELSQEWESSIVKRIPKKLLHDNFAPSISGLLEEVKEDYRESGKKSAGKKIRLYILIFFCSYAYPKKTRRPKCPESVNKFVRVLILKYFRDDTKYLLFAQDKCPLPSQWRYTFIDVKAKIERNLYLGHNIMRRILNLWVDFSELRMINIKPIRNNPSAFRLTEYRSLLLVHSEHCRDRLLNT